MPDTAAILTQPVRGYTTADVAARFRVGEDKVRGWIMRGELAAINTSNVRCARPRYVVTPEALMEFEKSRQAATPARPTTKRKRKPTAMVDYYPD
jgi:transposase